MMICLEPDTLIPIEVKGGRHLTAKSILNYLKRTPGERGYRFSDKRPLSGEYIDDLPLYVACAFSRLMAQRKTLANT